MSLNPNTLSTFSAETAAAAHELGSAVVAESFDMATYSAGGALEVHQMPGAELVMADAGSVAAANQSPNNTVSCQNCGGGR